MTSHILGNIIFQKERADERPRKRNQNIFTLDRQTIHKRQKRLSAETYNRYPDFKRKVIDINMREINDLAIFPLLISLKNRGESIIMNGKFFEACLSVFQHKNGAVGSGY